MNTSTTATDEIPERLKHLSPEALRLFQMSVAGFLARNPLSQDTGHKYPPPVMAFLRIAAGMYRHALTPPAVPVSFGSMLIRLRMAARLTQAELAAKTGIAAGTIANFEQRRYEPRASDVFAIARALGHSPEVFEACDFTTKKNAGTKGAFATVANAQPRKTPG